jgi:hypothetical protein
MPKDDKKIEDTWDSQFSTTTIFSLLELEALEELRAQDS